MNDPPVRTVRTRRGYRRGRSQQLRPRWAFTSQAGTTTSSGGRGRTCGGRCVQALRDVVDEQKAFHDMKRHRDIHAWRRERHGHRKPPQHEGFLGAGNAITKRSVRASRATRCSSATSTAEWTLCNFAHASLSASVWQQQLEKHCSAVAHPQGLSMHGNGFERSLPASRLAAGESVASAPMFPSGKGKPEATSE